MTDFLPKEFWFSHNFSLYLHDCLANLIVYGEDNEAFNVEFTLKTQDHADEFSKLEGVQISDWLAKEGYSSELGDLLLKTVFPAMLADFCQFIYEALNCSKRGRLTVTYALLRKPLRENLLYLEWLLADPEDLLNTLYNKPITELAMSKLLNHDNALNIINQAVERTPNSEMYDPKFFYDLRFNKTAEFGFYELWNKATHLITTQKDIKTEPQNLNFIFSDDDSRLSQWYHIYTRLPFLLFYATDVAETLMTIILKDIRPSVAVELFHRKVGFILWCQESQKLTNGIEGSTYSIPDNQELTFECPRCNRKISSDEKRLRKLFEKRKMRCPHCYRKLSIEALCHHETG